MPPIIIDHGPFSGWMSWRDRPQSRFSDLALGPFYFRDEEHGSVRCWMDTQHRHTNKGNALHGGFLMSFADMAYYGIAWRSLEETRAVTLTANFEFLGAGVPDVPVEAIGKVLKETGKLIFVHALVEQAGVPILSTSATLRKIRVSTGGDAG